MKALTALAITCVVLSTTSVLATTDMALFDRVVEAFDDHDSVQQQACDATPAEQLLQFNDVDVDYAWTEASSLRLTKIPSVQFDDKVKKLTAGLVVLSVLILVAWVSAGSLTKWVLSPLLITTVASAGLGGWVSERFETATALRETGETQQAILSVAPIVELLAHPYVQEVITRMEANVDLPQKWVDDTLRVGISYALSSGDFPAAGALASLQLPSATALQIAALGRAARHALSAGFLETGYHYAERADKIRSSRETQATLNGLRAHYAMRYAASGDLALADRTLREIGEAPYSNEVHGKAIGYVARKRVLEHLAQGTVEENYLAGALEIFTHYANRAKEHRVRLTLRSQCDASELLSLIGKHRFDNDDVAGSIQYFVSARTLVQDEAISEHILPVATWMRGSDALERGEVGLALSDLRFSHERLPASEALNCDRATAEAMFAYQQVENRRGQAAIVAADIAYDLCPTTDIQSGRGSVYLAAGEQALQTGKTTTALSLLATAANVGDAATARIAAAHAMAVDASPQLKQRLLALRQWADVPTVTGFGCGNVEEHGCDNIALFNERGIIGYAGFGSDEVYFDRPDTSGNSYYAADIDASNPGFDIWQIDRDLRSEVWYESDGDGRPDRRQVTVNGSLISDEPLSGRVRARIASLVVGIDTDFWSAPDPYFCMEVDGASGCSPALRNTHYGTFAGYGIGYHHRYGDCLRWSINDRDIWRDDVIDVGGTCNFPQNREYIGDWGNAAIQLVVEPTEIMGWHRAEAASEAANVFLAPSRLTETGQITELIRQANAAEATSRTKAMIASILGPEAIVLGTAKRASMATQLGIGIVSWLFLDHELTTTEDE